MEGAVTVMPNLADLISTLTGLVTSAEILTYMGTVISGTVGIYLTWKFGRRLVKSFLKAITGGKISF